MKFKCSIFWFFALITTAQATEQKSLYWQADGGELKIHFFYDLLSDYGIVVDDGITNRKQDWSQNELRLPVRHIGGLDLWVPHDGLKGVTDGELSLMGQFLWHHQSQALAFNSLKVRPTSRALKAGELTVLDITDETGQVLFYLDHIHAGFNENKTAVEFNNMDLRVSAHLAKVLNKPFLSGLVVGHAHMKNNVVVPVGYESKLPDLNGTCVADDWPGPGLEADIQLIAMEAQYVRSIGTDHVVFTPSATLKNISQADVAWYEKFSGTFPPYNNDQHPYLSWSMYREIDGRFEQIGDSGIKHAFFTVNSGCSCAGGHVIFPTCEDTYSVGNNDLGAYLGPRAEINSFAGLWESTGSFFDQNADGSQDNTANGTDENRMVVAEVDFVDNNLSYYISSWYVVREDVDIFNSMGHKAYNISPNGGGWSLAAASAFTNGPASDQYVTPGTLDLSGLTASDRILQAGEGHLTVAVKVVDLGGGLYRYNYMVENHDYDPQIQTVKIDLNQFNSFSDFVFSDVDESAANDWTANHSHGQLILQAPAGNAIEWGTLHSFSFTSDAVPQATDVHLVGLENGSDQFSASVIGPTFIDLIFENGFE